MNSKIFYDESKPYLTIKTDQPVTVDDCNLMVESILNHPKFPSPKGSLIDMRNSSFQNLSIDKILDIAKIVGSKSNRYDGSKTALVVTQKLAFELSSIFELLTSGKVPFEIGIFYSSESADNWLQKEESITKAI
jgi:hypothetical protein